MRLTARSITCCTEAARSLSSRPDSASRTMYRPESKPATTPALPLCSGALPSPCAAPRRRQGQCCTVVLSSWGSCRQQYLQPDWSACRQNIWPASNSAGVCFRLSSACPPRRYCSCCRLGVEHSGQQCGATAAAAAVVLPVSRRRLPLPERRPPSLPLPERPQRHTAPRHPPAERHPSSATAGSVTEELPKDVEWIGARPTTWTSPKIRARGAACLVGHMTRA